MEKNHLTQVKLYIFWKKKKQCCTCCFSPIFKHTLSIAFCEPYIFLCKHRTNESTTAFDVQVFAKRVWYNYKYFVYAQIGFGVNANTAHRVENVLKCDIVLYHLIVATRTTSIPYLWYIETEFSNPVCVFVSRMPSYDESHIGTPWWVYQIIFASCLQNEWKSNEEKKNVDGKGIWRWFSMSFGSIAHFSFAIHTKTVSNTIYANDKRDLLRSMFKQRWMHVAEHQQQQRATTKTAHAMYFFFNFILYIFFLTVFFLSCLLWFSTVYVLDNQRDNIMVVYTIKIRTGARACVKVWRFHVESLWFSQMCCSNSSRQPSNVWTCLFCLYFPSVICVHNRILYFMIPTVRPQNEAAWNESRLCLKARNIGTCGSVFIHFESSKNGHNLMVFFLLRPIKKGNKSAIKFLPFQS